MVPQGIQPNHISELEATTTPPPLRFIDSHMSPCKQHFHKPRQVVTTNLCDIKRQIVRPCMCRFIVLLLQSLAKLQSSTRQPCPSKRSKPSNPSNPTLQHLSKVLDLLFGNLEAPFHGFLSRCWSSRIACQLRAIDSKQEQHNFLGKISGLSIHLDSSKSSVWHAAWGLFLDTGVDMEKVFSRSSPTSDPMWEQLASDQRRWWVLQNNGLEKASAFSKKTHKCMAPYLSSPIHGTSMTFCCITHENDLQSRPANNWSTYKQHRIWTQVKDVHVSYIYISIYICMHTYILIIIYIICMWSGSFGTW